jgi:hypothetical protein
MPFGTLYGEHFSATSYLPSFSGEMGDKWRPLGDAKTSPQLPQNPVISIWSALTRVKLWGKFIYASPYREAP